MWRQWLPDRFHHCLQPLDNRAPKRSGNSFQATRTQAGLSGDSMKLSSFVLFALLLALGCLKNDELSATQWSSRQTTTQSQSASRPAGTTQTTAEPASSVPATLGNTQELETIPDKPKTVVIPAGSVITVRLVNPPDSSSKTGDTFTAIVTGLITVGGEVVVPLGTAVRGQVTAVKAKKNATEKARLKLALTSLTIDGTPYRIQTKLVEIKAKGQGTTGMTTNTAEGAGGSAGSDLVFKLTVPVTVNRLRGSSSGGQASPGPVGMAGCS